MPVDMSVDGAIYQVRLKWRLHGQQCINVIHFLNRGSQDIDVNLIQPIINCIVNHLLPVLTNQVTLEAVDWKIITGTVAQEGVHALSSGNIGALSGDGLPTTNAAVLSLKTVRAGRSGRGRMFLPGIAESSQANSLVDATFIAAAVAFLACMITAFFNSDPLHTPQFHWMLRSKKLNQYFQIKGGEPKAVVATMRSRKLGVGV
jgi:hypothetical protein